MHQFVEDYVRTCETCCRAKMPRHHPYGLLEPLSIPNKLWQYIALDFITDLSISTGFNAILTVVDRYMKMTHFQTCTKEITSEETAKTITCELCWHHGLPDSIISDCGPQFISKFWKNLFKMLKVPPTNRQTSRTDKSNARTISSVFPKLSPR